MWDFGLEMQGVAAAERTRRVGETLELVGWRPFAARFRVRCRAASSSAWRSPGRW